MQQYFILEFLILIQVIHDTRLVDDIGAENADDADEEDVDDHEEEEKEINTRTSEPCSRDISATSDRNNDTPQELPWEPSDIDNCEQLQMHRLSEWDYPIFELADTFHDSVLSRVST